MRTKKNIEKLRTTEFEDLPKVLSRIQDTDDGTTYQGVQLTYCKEAVAYFGNHMNWFITSVLECFKDRIKDQHTDFLTDVLTLLATHGWGNQKNQNLPLMLLNT